MQRRKFSREFKLEAVKLVRDRGVSMAQAARDLDLHINVLRKWVGDHGADPGGAFPGHGQMRPEQLEIERLRRENAKLKAERDILKNPRPISRGTRYEVREHPRSIEGSGRYRGFARLSVSRAAAFMPGWAARPACVPAAMRCLAPECEPASSPAIAHTVPGGSGMMCWPKASHVACIASSA